MTTPRLAKLHLVPLLVALLAACGAGPQQDASSLLSGGQPGSPCSSDGKLACAPDGRSRVRCAGGTWQIETECGELECVEQRDQGQTSAQCRLRQAKRPDVAAACSKAMSCDAGPYFFELCVAWTATGPAMHDRFGRYGLAPDTSLLLGHELSSRVPCLLAAKDCPGVLACLAAPLSLACANGDDDATVGCSGDVAWYCDDGRRVAHDCAEWGLRCQQKTSSYPDCAQVQPCAGPTALACQGDVATACFIGHGLPDWTLLSLDCAAVGLKCDVSPARIGRDASPGGLCGGAGPACNEYSTAPHCEGDHVVRCEHGQERRWDCAFSGLHCLGDVGSGGEAIGCSPVADCFSPRTCEGDTLAYCESDRRVGVDCADWGLACGKSGHVDAPICMFPQS
jgi:hypothetical protein